jgi:hypothetical protein
VAPFDVEVAEPAVAVAVGMMAAVLLDSLLKQSSHESRPGYIWRIVSEYGRHFLIERVALYLFKPDGLLDERIIAFKMLA